MTGAVAFVCAQHPDRHDCPDCLIDYSPKLREFGILIHDGGASKASISFCPWCGSALPPSLRDEWFDRLDQLGIDPWVDEIPSAYTSDEWWRHPQPIQE